MEMKNDSENGKGDEAENWEAASLRASGPYVILEMMLHTCVPCFSSCESQKQLFLTQFLYIYIFSTDFWDEL